MCVSLEGLRLIINSVEVSILFYVIMIDIFIGISKAFISKKLNSHIGLTGLIKHSVVYVLVVTMGLFSPLLGLEVIFKGLVLFYIFQYAVSIVESLITLGVPVPQFIVDKLAKLETDDDRYKRYKDEDELRDHKIQVLEDERG